MKTLSHIGINFIEELKVDINRIDTVIDFFTTEMQGYDAHLALEGVNIAVANAEHVGWYSYYDSIRVEIKKILEYVQMRAEVTKSKLWKKFKEKHSCVLTQKDIEMYIKSEAEYIEVYFQVLCVDELYEKSNSIVESFKIRGYNLKNLTQLKIANYEEWVI